MYKMYEVEDIVFNEYILNTKRGKNSTKECVKRKLFAMMLVSTTVEDNGCGCQNFRFGSFNILVNEKSDEIGMVFWTPNKAIYVSPEQKGKLDKLYEILGIGEDGQTIERDIDEILLKDFCLKENLTNIYPFKRHFMDFSHVLD